MPAARQLAISPLTVKTHLEHVCTKLGVASRTAAVAAWRLMQPTRVLPQLDDTSDGDREVVHRPVLAAQADASHLR